ncbi:MAG: T9SS type A sorting domain-containing protein [Calditrichaeota bacterium]|nr:T9SS type A sorting domain-containing protein [Calditrichota bacterium]
MNDEDFEIVVKFNSGLTGNVQQGIYVEQDATNLLRIEFLGIGSGTNVFVASFTNGMASVKKYQNIGSSGMNPLYMRVLRQDNQWTISYSGDGSSYTMAISFGHVMTVNAVGFYAGNSAGYAHTALIDYFHNVNAPAISSIEEGMIDNIKITPMGSKALIEWQTSYPAINNLKVRSIDSNQIISHNQSSNIAENSYALQLEDPSKPYLNGLIPFVSSPGEISNRSYLNYIPLIILEDNNSVHIIKEFTINNNKLNHGVLVEDLIPSTQYDYEIQLTNEKGDLQENVRLYFNSGLSPQKIESKNFDSINFRESEEEILIDINTLSPYHSRLIFYNQQTYETGYYRNLSILKQDTISELKLEDSSNMSTYEELDREEYSGQTTSDAEKDRLLKFKHHFKIPRSDFDDKSVKYSVILEDDQGNLVNLENLKSFYSKSGFSAESLSVSANLPESFKLYDNYPNPFNPSTTLMFDVPETEGEQSRVQIILFNNLGQKVLELVNQTFTAGTYTVHWDGRNGFGQRVSSGIYFAVFKSKNYQETIKLMLMK